MSDEGTPPPDSDTSQSDVSMRREYTVVDSSVQKQYSAQMSVDEASHALQRVRIKDDNALSNLARESDALTGDSNNRKVSRNRKARSLYGVSPHCKFGPKGALVETSTTVLTIPDPASQKLYWHKPPLSVLVIRKLHDESVIMPFKELIVWLVQIRKMLVFVESGVLEEQVLVADEEFKQIQNKLQFFSNGKDDLSNKIDFIICLGGDGTLLYASSLFQQSVPPVMAFNMGSLGFLTPFQFQNYKVEINQALDGSASLLLRYRLKCVLCKADSECARVPIKHKDLSSSICGKYQYLVLNEVTVDRGSSPYLGNVDLFVEGHLVTSVQGDGLIISTPTGSTAYAVAAGASMIHPNVPCILITPICPHSLSFRPIVVPAGVEIKVKLSPDARGTACVSFDGRNRQEMVQGDILRITTAAYPVPSVCAKTQVEDWFDGLADCLHWNVRKTQKALTSSGPSTSSLFCLEQDDAPGSSQS